MWRMGVSVNATSLPESLLSWNSCGMLTACVTHQQPEYVEKASSLFSVWIP